MPRPSNTTKRRLQIVEGLMRVVSRDGMGAATTQRVARECELTPGLLHYHFQNKEEMLLGLMEHLHLLLSARTQVALGLEGWVAAFTQPPMDLGRSWVAVCAQAPSLPMLAERLEAIRHEWTADLVGVLGIQLAHQGKETQHARHLAPMVLTLLEGAVWVRATSPGAAPEPDLLRRQVMQIIQGRQ